MPKPLTSPAADLDQGDYPNESKSGSTHGGSTHGGAARTVKLKGGGSLSLTLAGINLLHLDADDRNFLFGLIDTMNAYARTAEPKDA